MERNKKDRLREAGSSLNEEKMKDDGAILDKLFRDSSNKEIQEEPETQPETVSAPKAQDGKKKRVIDTHKVFSFRAPSETVDNWRMWAKAKGIKADELGEKAINEYIKRHSLTAEQKQIYDLMVSQKKS